MLKSKIMEIMKDPQAVLIFDVDGVLAAFEYGEHNHMACPDDEWADYLKAHDAYTDARPLKTMQEWIETYANPVRTFVCTVTTDEQELEQKRDFVTRNYPLIPRDHVVRATGGTKKLDFLNVLSECMFPGLDPKYIVMIDDTARILTHIQEHSEFSTAHISSFIE